MSCLMTPVSGQKLILKLSTSCLKLITSVNELATFTIDFPPHMMGNFQFISLYLTLIICKGFFHIRILGGGKEKKFHAYPQNLMLWSNIRLFI